VTYVGSCDEAVVDITTWVVVGTFTFVGLLFFLNIMALLWLFGFRF
jgi:hypothetical protein